MHARYVIHTVGPVWNGGINDEKDKLKSCYKNSLELAARKNCKSIAFPNISTGIYKFPKELAAQIAVQAVREFVLNNNSINRVILVCFDDESERYFREALA